MEITNVDDMLSGFDIMEWFDEVGLNPPNIQIYPDFTNVFDELNEKNGHCCIVLYETSPSVGHWTIVFLDPIDNQLEFFDPYGIEIDDQLDFTFYEDMTPKLTQSFLDTGKDTFEINDLQFQKRRPSINTCGKWCCVRYWCSQVGISKEDFDIIFNQEIPLDRRDVTVNNMFNDLAGGIY